MVRKRSFFDEMRRMWERMDEMMGNLWEEPVLPDLKEKDIEVRRPDIDIIESDKELIVTSDIPGLTKEDIDLKVTEDSLEISAESKREEKEEKEGYLRRERSYRKFYRKVPLPKHVVPSEAKANYKNGVLEVRLTKKEETKSTKIDID
jgi:HSP20 family protein